MRTLRRILAVTAVAAATATLAPAPLWAGPDDGPRLASTMLVLDASGSMADNDPAGGAKMDAAKAAARTLITQAPDGAPVGLATYGTTTGSSDAEKQRGCQDVTVLRKVAPLDRAGLTTAVNGLTPRGYTPIGQALRTAAGALPSSGPRSIVLVSDGQDTCAPPDPCQVAADLHKQGLDLHIDTVGYGVDDTARRQLSCIAQATGGTYTDAPDASALRAVLPRVTAGALRNYQPAGTPVTGTAKQDGAPQLAPGRYLDSTVAKQARYYRVAAAGKDTVYFTASVPTRRGAGTGGGAAGLDVRVDGPDGKNCQAHADGHTTSGGDGGAVVAAAVFTPEKSVSTKCRQDGSFGFSVEYSPAPGQPAQLPVEIQVGVEPPLSGSGGAAGATAPVSFAAPTGTPVPVTGGGSFGSAAVLNGSGVYTDVVQSSEFVYYRVHLDWGQGLAYRVGYGAAADWDSGDQAHVESTVYAPFRKEVAGSSAAYDGHARTLPSDADAVKTLPVRYRNRELSDAQQQVQDVAGWYYISVKVGRLQSHAAALHAVPVRIEATVVGTKEPAPQYAQEAGHTGDAFGEGNASAGTTGKSAGTPAAAGNPSTTDTGLSAPGIAIAAAGVLLLLLAGAGAVVVLLRRRARP